MFTREFVMSTDSARPSLTCPVDSPMTCYLAQKRAGEEYSPLQCDLERGLMPMKDLHWPG